MMKKVYLLALVFMCILTRVHAMKEKPSPPSDYNIQSVDKEEMWVELEKNSSLEDPSEPSSVVSGQEIHKQIVECKDELHKLFFNPNNKIGTEKFESKRKAWYKKLEQVVKKLRILSPASSRWQQRKDSLNKNNGSSDREKSELIVAKKPLTELSSSEKSATPSPATSPSIKKRASEFLFHTLRRSSKSSSSSNAIIN